MKVRVATLFFCILVLLGTAAPARAAKTSASAGPALAIAFALDGPVRDLALELRERIPFIVEASKLLSELSEPHVASLIIAGLWIDDSELGREALQNVLLATGATYALKSLLGRSRPYTGERRWNGPTLEEDRFSHPSAHAAVSFALARTVAERRPEASSTAWSIAGAVALSRVLLDQHWTSDIVAGAMLGYASVGWKWTW